MAEVFDVLCSCLCSVLHVHKDFYGRWAADGADDDISVAYRALLRRIGISKLHVAVFQLVYD